MGTHSHDGHRGRLRKRFMQEGIDNFEQHNVLELLLFYTIPRADTNVVAHRLIDAFGSLSAVFDASTESLMKIKGVGEKTAALIKLIPEMSRAYLVDKAEPFKQYNSPEQLCSFFVPKFVGRTRECVYVACLDNAGKMIACRKMLEGTANMVLLPLKEIVQFSYTHNAMSVVIAHNHPFGLCNPSKADHDHTIELKMALAAMEIRLLDHIVVGKNGDALSMAEYKMFD